MYIEINGLKINYQKTGVGTNLIMLHGWGQDVSTFWPLIDLLKEKFTLFLIDLPGFGRSDLPKNTFTTSDYANLLAEFIKKNSLKDCIILGHSFGGKVAIKFAYLYPNLLNKLILEGSAGIKPEYSLFNTFIYILAKLIHYGLPNVFNLKSKLRHKFYKAVESDYANAGKMKNILLGTLEEDLTLQLPKIKTQTLVIWGEEDRAVSLTYGKKIYRLIKNSKMVVIDNVGHFPHLESPERFAYYVKDFS